jgi:hypothetical protein
MRLECEVDALRTAFGSRHDSGAHRQESDESHPQPEARGRPPAHGSPERTTTVDGEWQRFVVSTSTITGHLVYSRGALR